MSDVRGVRVWAVCRLLMAAVIPAAVLAQLQVSIGGAAVGRTGGKPAGRDAAGLRRHLHDRHRGRLQHAAAGGAAAPGTTVPWSNEVLHVVGPLFLLIDLLLAVRRRALP